MTTVISVENLSKQYDLGVIGTGTLSRDLNRWWARVRKQPDPYARIGQKDQFEEIGGSILALDDISFTVNQGEALGIIGKNGAGKSTLLKILSRVTAPTSGSVKVKGRIGSLLEVGTGFHPELTGRENVYLNGAILGMRKDEVTRKFDEIVAFSGVERFIDTPVKRYSSGMYVRLAFAVAAHLDPEILIVDEVLAVGDAEFQKKCLGKMGDVATEGRTILFVSHNMVAIDKLCNECILLQGGTIFSKGKTEEVILDYHKMTDRQEEKYTLDQYRVNWIKNGLISSICFMSIENNLQRFFRIDEDIIVEIDFNQTIPQQGNPYIAIGINNWRDNRVFTLTSYDGRDKKMWTRANKVRCRIPAPNLLPGKYSVKATLNVNGHDEDIIENYPAFEVIVEDFFGSGRLPRDTKGVILKDSFWDYLLE